MGNRLFTDGSVCRQEEYGGWAFILETDEELIQASGALLPKCDANQMELEALEHGLRALPHGPCDVQLYCDSLHVRDVLKALFRHAKPSKKATPSIVVRNGILTRALPELIRDRRIHFHQVFPDADDCEEQHRRCHALSREARERFVERIRDSKYAD
ncbi:hypothetical protein COU78_02970 [Candidatus Peregrinibacteria bacterium CG10_big_fil_rev_8_21_14_0_10_49_24]|nr:MAG: hypothetical protein COV83_06805 [Candidatus Peregrinibacteria bacterium CG11_big_fil_rev_8_21_14_0_20_49_14]PIR51091.1 MAG: hypothetical protein COU78_02970 [Candidatus Peregrinibacteria bacterium CG10_big_fil_rev_8_21_14_0_10_49_24]PJA67644.1 MAG: hypothetical protein CO157_04450 [Candidatus Peregrinibacteria bacterium CG_4_9_14_3_um_filter_49_12]